MFSLKRFSKIFLSFLCMLSCVCGLFAVFAKGEVQCVIERSPGCTSHKKWKVEQIDENRWVMIYYSRNGVPFRTKVTFWREGEKLYAQQTLDDKPQWWKWCFDMYPAPDSEGVIEFSCHALHTRKDGTVDPAEVCYGQWFEPKVKVLPGVCFEFERMLGICVNPRLACTEHVSPRENYRRCLKFGWFSPEKDANLGYVTRDFEEGTPHVRTIVSHDGYYVDNIKLPDDVLWAALCVLPELGAGFVSWG